MQNWWKKVICAGLVGISIFVTNHAEAGVRESLLQTVFHSGGRISCDFDGYKNTSGRHEGIDLVNYHNAPVYAAVSGTIIKAGDDPYHTVSIYDAKRNKSVIYLHFSSLRVTLNQWVNKGDLIGYQGNYGAPKGSHVHIEVRDGKRPSAAKSVDDPKLDNSNPWPYWESVLGVSTVPQNLRISTDKEVYTKGEKINFTFSAEYATVQMGIPIDINGVRAEWLDVLGRSSYSYTANRTGRYNYSLYARNEKGEKVINPYKEIRVIDNYPVVPAGGSVKWIANGEYIIKPVLSSGLCLTVQNASTANHAKVILDMYGNKKNQHWKIQRIGNSGWYSIIDANSGKSLDNEGGRYKNGNNVWMYPYLGVCEQWRFISCGGGRYNIQANTAGSYVLDVPNGNARTGQYLWLYESNRSGAQQWILEPVKVVNVTRNKKGDVNSDGKIDANDLNLLMSYVRGKSVSINKINADVNGDGTINIMDAVALNKILKG